MTNLEDGMQPSPERRAPAEEQPADLAVLPWQGDDHELLRRAKARDTATGALLYDRYWKDVNKLVWSLLGDDPDHDDIVADAFERLLKGVHRVRDADKLRAWVMTVTANVVRSEFGRRARRRRFHLTDDTDRYAATLDDPEARALVRRVYGVLEGMSEKERAAFVLRHIEGRELREVANVCACSLATIKRRLVRARKRFTVLARRDSLLKRRLERYGEEKSDDHDREQGGLT